MPRSFVDQDFVLTVLAVYGATVAFNRWVPNIDLIAVDAHPKSYVQTFTSASESSLLFYKIFLGVDIVRNFASALLESAAFSFALSDEKFDLFSYAPLLFRILFVITKDFLMLGCVFAAPESNDVASEKVAEMFPTSVYVDQGLTIVGGLLLAIGLYNWTYAIGRDKRQVIKEKKTN
ncbi:hypothetical protein BGZ88_004569 [Linnemannia elongata]|uniref:Uncharacterized protein n=1 Tax=Linnemannia elongata AG-77 TaxID=1314771 RepID=A0A197JSH1_9FUNG|nr:hypothetical protein BGZ88_004569 [Linnemannia elongata]KAG0071604.1 hypothetical protein BGZ89_010110 [Linnemannia elongata]KAK5823033.1 hypothetical protein F5H01DRAFT_333346 [Linnemannia elongata]OAQ28227.1 hypothetical protein K457DRAFT_156395 [Linnemannia elongata AG-77]